MNNPLGFLKMKSRKHMRSVMFAKRNTEDGTLLIREYRWKRHEQAEFLYRLGELLAAGYHLSDALLFLQSQERDKRKHILATAIGQLKDGFTLHEVLEKMKFHTQLLQFVHYAEFYGNLSGALMEAGDYWRKRERDRNQTIKILLYPALLFTLVLACFAMLQGILLPKFKSLYENMNIEPGLFLKTILFLSAATPYLLTAFIAAILIFFVFKTHFFNRMDPFRRKLLLLRIPLLGMQIRMFDTYYVSYQISGLLSGGLSINDAMKLFADHNQKDFFRKVGESIYDGLNEGHSLETIFKHLPFFESYLCDVLANGQKNGKLDKELYHYSRILLLRMEEKMAALIKLVQPILFASVGMIVIAVYLSVLLPMFTVLDGL